MSHSPLRIRKAAVLGAGVMGAQIAAHLTNADVDTVLFDLPAKEGDKNGIVLKAIANLGQLSPSPGADRGRAAARVGIRRAGGAPPSASKGSIVRERSAPRPE